MSMNSALVFGTFVCLFLGVVLTALGVGFGWPARGKIRNVFLMCLIIASVTCMIQFLEREVS